MPITPNYDLDIDTTLGGSNASDYTIASQKAVKSYVDNHSVTTTSSVTSGSTAALTSGGAYTNLVRRLSTSAATGSASQGVYVDANGQVQTCTAVTSTYAATGTAPVNGTAVSNAIAVKQDTLVSGSNIKTINGNSLLGSGNITIETSSTPNVDGTTISYNSSDALQAIAVKNVRDGSTLPIWHGTEYQWNHGDPTTWYYWQTSVLAQWVVGGSLPASRSWCSVAYGNGRFVAIAGKHPESYYSVTATNKGAYSTDGGTTWTETTMTSSNVTWNKIDYFKGKFIASNQNYYTDGLYYSSDGGETWNKCTITGNFFSGTFQQICHSDDVIFAFSSGASPSACSLARSTDGINWTTYQIFGMSAYTPIYGVAYGDGKLVAATGDGLYYSTDGGENWTATNNKIPTGITRNIVYGNDMFVAVASDGNAGYSTDGINWTINSSKGNKAYIYGLAYGDGDFIAVGGGGSDQNSSNTLYSTDGINWEIAVAPTATTKPGVAYGDGKFVAVDFNSDASAIFTVQYDKCYTDTANPTTSSVVYSAPAVTSSYTISSVTSGAITLSNNNTYYYNQSGNTQTYQTIGDAHPEYLCFIDGVGVKMGNTMIATNNSNS